MESTTPDELQAMTNVITSVFLQRTGAKRLLEAMLIDRFWADESYLTTREDVLCAWANLPIDEKLDYVRDWARADDCSFFAAGFLSLLAKKQAVA